MFGIGDKVSWSGSNGIVTSADATYFEVKFENGGTIAFLQSSGKYDDGTNLGSGAAVTLVSKAKSKKSVTLYRWEKVSTTSTGRPFVKQTEGLYDEEHASRVLIPEGYVKVASSARTIEV